MSQIVRLSAKKMAAIEALLTHPTVIKAASEVGISARTLHRWLLEPEFAQALEAAQRERVRHAIRRLRHQSNRAGAH